MPNKSSDQRNRGRDAQSPQHIPWGGWKDVMKRVKNNISTDRLSMVSAAMAYYALFAFVPSLSAVVLIYAWISDPSEIQEHMKAVSDFIPEEAQALIQKQLSGLATTGALGLGAIGALLIALWSASKGSKAIIEAMNVIYDEHEERGFFKLNIFALGMTLLAAVMAIVAMGVIIVIPSFAKYTDFLPFNGIIIQVLGWIILLSLFTFFLAFAYRFGPDRRKAKWKWVTPGAVFSSLLWAMVSALFSWYAQEFGNFNKTYGSLGAIVVLMLWFYISSFVVLLGGEINAEIEHQTKIDSTKEPDRPMGEREAYVADTLGDANIHH